MEERTPSQSSRRKERHRLEGYDSQGFESYHRKDKIKELQKFFVPDFVKMAFHTPPGCGSFWDMMEEKIEKAAELDCDPFNRDVDAVLGFLGNYFSPSIIGRVRWNFFVLQHSFLGFQYTLRYGKSDIAITTLHDIERQCCTDSKSPLYEFMGEGYEEQEEEVVDSGEDGGDWQRQGRRRNCTREQGNRGGDGGASHGAGRGGRQAGGGSDRGRGRGEDHRGQEVMHFQSMEEQTIIVDMLPFTTPEHGEPDRGRTLKSRSWEFATHGKIGDLSAKLYDPDTCETGMRFLYHGTRHCCLDRFRSEGINPRLRRNEFSRDRAFYTSNSLRHAYEHPLHYHASESVTDHVSVLVFDVDVEVLHGQKPPPGATLPFACKWFQDTEEEEAEWQDFCRGNFTQTRPSHSYDIVIGPICRPSHNWSKLKLKVDGAPLTQVGFCSTQARLWLEQSFIRVYMEKRLVQEPA